MQRESWQPRRRRRHRQQPDSRPANGHPMCDRSAYLLQNIPPSTSYTLSLLKKRLGDGASCINRDSARRRHNQLLMETVGLLNLRNNLMSRGEQARGCPACRDPDTINRYWTSIFRFLSASLRRRLPALVYRNKELTSKEWGQMHFFINLCLTLRCLVVLNKITRAPCKAAKANTA